VLYNLDKLIIARRNSAGYRVKYVKFVCPYSVVSLFTVDHDFIGLRVSALNTKYMKKEVANGSYVKQNKKFSIFVQ
jgi:hypothetical protein